MTIAETRLPAPTAAYLRRPTRKQPAHSAKGMVTSNHPLASLAGNEMLVLGGNAVDAAIATMFALSVVEPMMTTIFGAGFINMRLADGSCITIDNYATVPGAATADMFEPIPGNLDNDVVGQLNSTGYLAVATGGTLLGWATAVERYGRLDLATVVAPAVRFARGGFSVSPYLAQSIRDQRENLARYPATAEVFLPSGAPPQSGDRIVRTDYAATLETVGWQGPDYLYGGPLGQAIADDMARNGGVLTMADIESYEIFERPPVRGEYRGYELVAMAPPSSGGTHIIQILNMLEGFDVAALGFGSPDGVHVLAEAMKIAFADRFKFMADPTTTNVPVGWLTSKSYATERRVQIDMQRAQHFTAAVAPEGEGASTTHCCAMDADGNVVTTTQTLNGGFGSKVTVPGTGMLLNNCMHLMDPNPGRTNSIAPNKRILSSMSPTIVLKDGKPFMALGTPGGVRIFGSVMQAIVNVIDHGMTFQQAVEAPRMWDRGPILEIEEGYPDVAALQAELEHRRHIVQQVFRVAGGMNGIRLDPESGLIEGVACWRADGAPMGYSGGEATLSSVEEDNLMWQ
jgi:gamma-glutamyltranspeptidase/glutathione hydrolase